MHVLQKNETLYSIARKYDTSVDELVRINNIQDVRKLRVGTEIIVSKEPGPVYKVEKGDTLYGIARAYDVDLESLLAVNSLQKDYVLKVGDILRIPAAITATEIKHTAEGEKDPVETTEPVEQEEAAETVETVENGKQWPIIGVPVPSEGKLSGVYIKGEEGMPVRTISSGTVVWVGPYRGFGKVVLIQSKDRYVYIYGGNAEIIVETGEEVFPGTVISTLGINPHSKKPELFFSVFRNGKPVDPEEAPRN